MTSLKKFHQNILKSDIQAGFLVFLIALPLCLGIALASGYPPAAGIITAIVGGFISSWLGMSRLTIKGPAAGMIVIVIGAVTELGQGDIILGYKRALAVGVVAAILQMICSQLRFARLGIAISKSVVHGMLAAIGVIIIAKQIHVALGVKPVSKDIIGLITEIPHSFIHANPLIALIGALSLFILIFWPKISFIGLKKVPAQVIVLASVIPLSILLNLSLPHAYSLLGHTYAVSPQMLVQLPTSLMSAITFPDFSVVASYVSVKYILMFTIVGMIESTLTVIAIDGITKPKKASDLDKDLFALSAGNLVSSLIGGLPMISEIVRSKANVDAGAVTHRANFFHGLCLLVFVSLLPNVLGLIPLAALAAMLVFVGFRLASPKEFTHVKEIGNDQFVVFLVTMITTLATDLLIGVVVGKLIDIILNLVRGSNLSELFRPKITTTNSGTQADIKISGAAAFPSLLGLSSQIQQLSVNVKKVILDVHHCSLIDHTFLSSYKTLFAERPDIKIEIAGLDEFRPMSDHPTATHLHKSPHKL